jgi:hypothetical protein
MLLSKKICLSIQFVKILHTCAFSDEINFEKFKIVVKKLIDRVGIWTSGP